MFLTFVPLLCVLSSSVLALPVESRPNDLAQINLAMQHVTDALRGVETALQGLRARGDPTAQILDVLSRESFLQQETNIGISVIKRAPDVGATEALGLMTSIQTVSDVVKQVADGWQTTVTKNLVKKANKRDVVLKELQNSAQVNAKFSDTLIAKLPYIYQGVATVAKTRNTGNMNGAIEDFL